MSILELLYFSYFDYCIFFIHIDKGQWIREIHPLFCNRKKKMFIFFFILVLSQSFHIAARVIFLNSKMFVQCPAQNSPIA